MATCLTSAMLLQLDPALVKVILAFARQDSQALQASVLELLTAVTGGSVPMPTANQMQGAAAAAQGDIDPQDALAMVPVPGGPRGDIGMLLSAMLDLMNR